LAWLLAQGADIVPIPGSKRRRTLEENVEALKVHLTSEDFTRIEQIVSPQTVAGPRYSQDDLNLVNR
jgi:aryl-alcohol dehydrogenase-like predicted oxidoreductase